MNLIPWRSDRERTKLATRTVEPVVERFRTEMDRMFDRFFNEPFGALSEPMAAFRSWGPTLDLAETDKEVVVKAELPGVEPKDVDVEITGNVLTIAGEKREQSERKDGDCLHTERRFGKFRRVVQLPAYVDTEKVSAEHVNGVLTIHLEKQPSATPKRVPVKTG